MTLSIKRNKIVNEDCVYGLKSVPDQVFDLILADPPYVISKPSQFGTMPDRKNPRTGTNFGKWDTSFDNRSWLQSAFAKLKKGGSLLVFNDIKKISIIIDEAKNAGFEYKDTIIWNKSNPMPRNTSRRYVQDIEICIWFVKPGNTWTFNKIKKPYMSCVKKIPCESGGAFKRIHPTQKPLKLILELIKTHSNPGDLILDPFMGSGTTAIACIESKRDFFGFEIDPNYYNASLKRIEEYKNKI